MGLSHSRPANVGQAEIGTVSETLGFQVRAFVVLQHGVPIWLLLELTIEGVISLTSYGSLSLTLKISSLFNQLLKSSDFCIYICRSNREQFLKNA